MSKAKRKTRVGRRRENPVTITANPWDQGAMGPANRHRLREEEATEIDPETGKESPNPNNVRRFRRIPWLAMYERAGHLDQRQFAAAEKLRIAADGLRDKDPLAAIVNVGPAADRSDPLASRFDRRRYYHELWALIPAASKPVIERVVIEDKPIWDGNSAQRERHMQRLREGIDAIA